MLHKCKYVSKNVLQIYFLFVLLLIFQRKNGVLSVFWCYGQMGHTLKAFIIIIKTPFYLLKINH